MASPLLELGPDVDAEGGRLTRRQLRRLLGRMPPWAPLEARLEERAEIEPGGHAFTDRLRTVAYAWLERWLDPLRR